MDDSDAVLAANLEFYRAFTTRDAEAMDGAVGAARAGRLRPSRLAGARRPRCRHGELARHPFQPRFTAHRLL